MAGEARYLGRDERAVLRVRRHAIVLLRPFLLALGALLLASAGGFVASPDEGGDLVDTFLGLVAAFFFLRLLWKLWQWWADHIVVTNQRILEISGVLTRKVASMPLGKVTDMTYRRSIAGRILRYGDIIVESAGQDQALSCIERLPQPDYFYRTITSLVTGGDSAPDRLSQEQRPEDEEDTGPLPRVIT